jgi:hypothetical protein
MTLPQQLKLPLVRAVGWEQLPEESQQACRQLLVLLLRQTVQAEAGEAAHDDRQD